MMFMWILDVNPEVDPHLAVAAIPQDHICRSALEYVTDNVYVFCKKKNTEMANTFKMDVFFSASGHHV